MLLTWIAAGNEPARFWVLTFKEIDREMRGAKKRLEREYNERAWLAWHVVALDRVKHFPRLEKMLIGGTSGRHTQSPEQLMAAAKAMFIAWGGDPEQLRTLQ